MKNLGKYICLNDYQTFKKNTIVDVFIDDENRYSYTKVGGEKYSVLSFCCTTKYYNSKKFKKMGLVSLKEHRKQKLLKINESR